MPAAPSERACAICPAWAGFSLENGDAEAGFLLKVLGETPHGIGRGSEGAVGMGLPHFHPLRLIPGGTHWVRASVQLLRILKP